MRLSPYLQLLAIIGLLLTTACSRPALSGNPALEARLEAAPDEDYRLGVGDKVRLLVFNEDSLSGEFSVNSAGNLTLPLVGDVPANNKTTVELAGDVQRALADGYLRNPNVSIEVITYRPYFILGEVKTPGQYPYSNGLTVMNAIATATGFTPRAEKNVVFIRRSGSDVEQAFRLTPDLKVYPGDTIRLGERFF